MTDIVEVICKRDRRKYENKKEKRREKRRD